MSDDETGSSFVPWQAELNQVTRHKIICEFLKADGSVGEFLTDPTLRENVFKDQVQSVDVLVSRWLLDIANPDDFDENEYFTPLEDAVTALSQLYWLFKMNKKKSKLVKQLLCEEAVQRCVEKCYLDMAIAVGSRLGCDSYRDTLSDHLQSSDQNTEAPSTPHTSYVDLIKAVQDLLGEMKDQLEYPILLRRDEDERRRKRLMETGILHENGNWRLMKDIFDRQLGSGSSYASNIGFQQCVRGSLRLVQRLQLYAKYERHKECVTALNFNETGTLIASGSKDPRVVIWDWVREKSVLEFDSGHGSCVFQAKFLPCSEDRHIVSCAADGQVLLTQLSATGASTGTRILAQHKGGVHKLSILPDSCHNLLSCGEDGITYQIDLRQEKPVRLCKTKADGEHVPLLSIDVNPFKSHEFCVGGHDNFIRIYDSRKTENSVRTEVVKEFCPRHLMTSFECIVMRAVYNYNGTAILGSYYGDDIYLFDNSLSGRASHVHRYSGHKTSISVKDAKFYGPKSEYVVSGSDCGNIFLWDVESEAVVNYLQGNKKSIVNVLEPHPHIPILATGGLGSDVKLWAPTAEKATDLHGLKKVINRNRRRIRAETQRSRRIDSDSSGDDSSEEESASSNDMDTFPFDSSGDDSSSEESASSNDINSLPYDSSGDDSLLEERIVQ